MWTSKDVRCAMGRVKKSEITPEGLTPKQKGFANDYLETGNGAEAVRKNYNLDPNAHPNLPSTIATENLRKPLVRDYIQEKLEAQKATPEFIISRLLKEVEDFNPAARLKALELLGKHLRLFGEKSDNFQILEQVKTVGWATTCNDSACKCICHGISQPDESSSVTIDVTPQSNLPAVTVG